MDFYFYKVFNLILQSAKNSILKDYLMKRIEKERSLSLYP